MQIKPSTALRNEYPQISQLAKVSGEPQISARTNCCRR